MTSEILHWDVDGQFITDIARDWLYKERQPFKKVLDLLINCMQGSNETKEQLNKHVDDILTFKSKLSGSTAQGTYGLYDETNTELLRVKYPEYKYYDYLKKDEDIPFSKCEYGFITPQGDFVPVEWCHHAEWAQQYIEAHGEYRSMLESNYPDSTDYMVYAKGYILLENPHQGDAFVQRPHKITKSQRETLYDYYMYHKRFIDAINLFKELDE